MAISQSVGTCRLVCTHHTRGRSYDLFMDGSSRTVNIAKTDRLSVRYLYVLYSVYIKIMGNRCTRTARQDVRVAGVRESNEKTEHRHDSHMHFGLAAWSLRIAPSGR